MPTASKSRVGNLPYDLTSFVGRRRELAETKRLLSVTRLVTITGAGGIGKTRLACRVASEVLRTFDDGVWLVDLSEIPDGSSLVAAVSDIVGKPAEYNEHTAPKLAEHLAPKTALLILDCCDQFIASTAALCEFLLRSCPGLRILTTTRQALGIGGEAVFRVPPMTVPSEDLQRPVHSTSRCEAITLFTERAATIVPEFGLTDANHGAVSAICRRLDGIPLAIELAAIRLRAMSVEQILQKLPDPYSLLSVGTTGAPARQQTLRRSIDWTRDLCSAEERALWARLSVFEESFDLDAAEGICAGNLAADEVLDLIASLIDKSILIREDHGATARYRQLGTLRDYGREQLQDDTEYQSLRRLHRDWYARLVNQANSEWISRHQVDWIARLEAEQPNLRAALEHCGTGQDGAERDTGLRIAVALYPFWCAQGMLGEGRQWFTRMLDGAHGHPSVDRIEGLYAAGVLAALQGDLLAARALIDDGMKYSAHAADEHVGLLDFYAAGCHAILRGHFSQAQMFFDKAVSVSRNHEAPLKQVWAWLGLALASGLSGDIARVQLCLRSISEIGDTRGTETYRGWILWIAALTTFQHGDLARADSMAKDCLRSASLVNDRLGLAGCLEISAWISGRNRDARRAALLLGAAHGVGGACIVSPQLLPHHARCEQQARRALGDRAFEAAYSNGSDTCVVDAVAFALGETQTTNQGLACSDTTLTRRERQVAYLVSKGMTNRAIASELVISQRTAQGHVEHILTKLGFNSRSQIAAWIVEQEYQSATPNQTLPTRRTGFGPGEQRAS